MHETRINICQWGMESCQCQISANDNSLQFDQLRIVILVYFASQVNIYWFKTVKQDKMIDKENVCSVNRRYSKSYFHILLAGSRTIEIWNNK